MYPISFPILPLNYIEEEVQNLRAHLSMNPRTAAMIHRVMESNLFPRIRLSGCRFAINANRVLIIRKSDHQPCFGHVLASTRWPIPRLEMSYTRLDTRRSTPLRALVCTTCTEYNARRRGNCRREMERAYRAHLRANRENVRLTRLRPVIERPGVVVVVVVVVSSWNRSVFLEQRTEASCSLSRKTFHLSPPPPSFLVSAGKIIFAHFQPARLTNRPPSFSPSLVLLNYRPLQLHNSFSLVFS